jgi:outer membrane receptor protein involved in Fe transport
MLAAVVGSLQAQTAPPDSSGRARDRQARHMASTTTVVLTRAEILETPAQTLDDVLRSISTVNLPAQGSLVADPASTSISMRGLAGNGVLVLLDGVPLNDAYFGTVNWLKIPVEQIETIEIVHGAATAQYAMHAVAGAILVTTRRPTTDVFELQGSFGRYLGANANPYRSDANRNYNTGRVNLLASKALRTGARLTVNANFTGTKGYWLEDGGDESFTQLSATTGSARLDFAPARQTIAFVQVGATALLPHTVDAATTDYRPIILRRLDARSADVTTGVTDNAFGGGVLEASAFYSDTRRYRIDGSFGAPSGRTPTHDGGLRTTWTRALSAGRRAAGVTLGGDLRIISSETRLRADSALPFESDARIAASGTSRMAGVFAEAQWSAMERLTLNAALRVDGFQSTNWTYATAGGVRYDGPSRTTGRVSPTVRVSYALRPTWILRAAAYAGANPPTHLALSPISGVGRAPVALGPERVVGGEFGFDLKSGPLSLFANVFQQNLRDGITDAGTDFDYALVNGEQRRSRGVEVAGEWVPHSALAIRASHTWLSAIVTENPFDRLSPEYVPLVGERDPHVPIHTFAGSIRSNLPGGLRATLRGRYQSRYTRTPEIGFEQPAPLAVFDAMLTIPLARELEVWIQGENVLNRRYGVTDLRANYRNAAPSLLTVGARLRPQR